MNDITASHEDCRNEGLGSLVERWQVAELSCWWRLVCWMCMVSKWDCQNYMQKYSGGG